MAIQINGKKVIQLGTANIPVLKGEKGDIGQQGEQGIQGIPGYTPVKGVDYMTSEDREQIADTVKADITPEITELKNGKVDKENGKGLSTNDFTNELKDKLDKLNTQDDKVVKGHYDEENKQIILELQSGNKIAIPVNDLLDDFYVKQTIDDLLKEQAEQINYLDKTLTRDEATGENINIKNSAEYPISNISIDTNIKQDSREGYNLYNFINNKMSINNGGTLDKDLDNNLYKFTPSSATQWQGFYYEFPQNFEAGKVYLSFKVKGDSATKIKAGLTGVLTNYKDITITSSYVQYDLEFTLTEAGTVTINFYNWNTDAVVPFYIKDIQVTINEQKPYEQYGSMPSIEFPSEIKTPKGKQSIYNGNKNLFKPTLYNQNGNTIYKSRCNVVIENEEIIFTPTTGKDPIFGNVINKNQLANGTEGYFMNVSDFKSISINITNPIFNKNFISFIGKDLKGISGYRQLFSNKVENIALPEGTVYVVIRIGMITGEVGKEYRTKIQVEGGSASTEIVPHQHQTQDLDLTEELLGTIVDKEDGSYFENRYGKYIFTGNETINKNSTDITNYLYYTNLLKDIANLTNIELYCSHLKENTLANLNNNNEEGIFLNSNGALYFNINSVLVENTAIKFKAFLKELYDAGTPIKIVYKLATPTYTKLTDEQQAQWNAIKKMHTYEGVTNIYTINDNGISPVINMKYVKSPKVVEENLQAQIDKLKNSIISMGGNV